MVASHSAAMALVLARVLVVVTAAQISIEPGGQIVLGAGGGGSGGDCASREEVAELRAEMARHFRLIEAHLGIQSPPASPPAPAPQRLFSNYCADVTCGAALTAAGWSVVGEFGSMDRFGEGVVASPFNEDNGWESGGGTTDTFTASCTDMSDLYVGGSSVGYVQKPLPQTGGGLTEVVVAFTEPYRNPGNSAGTGCDAIITDGNGVAMHAYARDVSDVSDGSTTCMSQFSAPAPPGTVPPQFVTMLTTTVDLSNGPGKVRIEEYGSGGNVAAFAYVLTRAAPSNGFVPSVYCAASACGRAAIADGWSVLGEFGSVDRFGQGTLGKPTSTLPAPWTSSFSNPNGLAPSCVDLFDFYTSSDAAAYVSVPIAQTGGTVEVVVAIGNFYDFVQNGGGAPEHGRGCAAVITDGNGRPATFHARDESERSSSGTPPCTPQTGDTVPAQLMTTIVTTVDLTNGAGEVRIEERAKGGAVAYIAYVLTRPVTGQ